MGCDIASAHLPGASFMAYKWRCSVFISGSKPHRKRIFCCISSDGIVFALGVVKKKVWLFGWCPNVECGTAERFYNLSEYYVRRREVSNALWVLIC
ncbi:hypothetical protein CEXT_448821 [Caerostris extrusa]|uniref:Uncharacterized protein n=1 Tax=Caerostris extrusa TaxID=172846 RepID=A0AAV4PN71_CAEEX|nr:hypothetical protein CEXT_448821 [Caerostris extrusa]